MAFSILDHIAKLEPSEHHGKYICPACGGNDLSINEKNGAYNCFNDDSAKHRAEIRNILAPLERWERPMRDAASYTFVYQNRDKEEAVHVIRDDFSGKKSIRQDYPSIPKDSGKRKAAIDQLRKTVVPYRYFEALEASEAVGLPIFIVEGELTCDKLWEIGLPSSTFLGGSGQYRANGDYSQLFRGKKVVLCPDRDEPGVALMKEVGADNPGAQWLYADPKSFEWDNLPQKGGYDLADWLDEGADQQTILASIVSKDRHEGKDGLPSFEEIISTLERMVGLYGNDARIAFEARQWMESHGIKLNAQETEKLLVEARGRVHGREELEILDAKSIAQSEDSRKWTIAGIVPESSVMLLAASPGTGKAQPLWSKVLTPHGWTTMGALKCGDEVIAGDGSIARVTNVFPQGIKPVYRVTMSDGSMTHCCDDHLWLTKTAQQRSGHANWTVKNLATIRNSLHVDYGKKRNHSIPMVGPVKFTKQDLPLHPYLLGVLLGDGHISNECCSITVSDAEITRRVESVLPADHCLKLIEKHRACHSYRINQGYAKGGIRDILRELHLFGKRSWEKFVPEQYLFSSVQDRIDLLHGLMDTDGTTSGTSTTFDSSSRDLANAVQFLVHSIGGKAVIRQRETFFTYLGQKKQGRTSYRVHISMPPGYKSFSIAGKASKETARSKYPPARFFDSIEYIGDQEAKCIMVDHPDRTYVTDDFIVTHNSTIVYNWALHVATGTDWSNRRCKKGKVLIIQCDEPVVDAAEKLQIIGYDDDALSNGMIDFIDRWRFSNIPQLLSYVQRYHPQLIMIDSLTSCLAGMDVDLIRSDAGNCIYELRDIANQYGCSIVILHHLNKSGGIRDSSSFEANVSEVVKLYRTDNNPDSTQFMMEWTKSRSGLAGKHFMQRDPATYGWFYKGPAAGGNEALDNLVNMINSRKHERFDRRGAAAAAGSWDSVSVGRLLEVARRQGLVATSFIVGPNGERTRMYQSWNYEEPDLDFEPAPIAETVPHIENPAPVQEQEVDWF